MCLHNHQKFKSQKLLYSEYKKTLTPCAVCSPDLIPKFVTNPAEDIKAVDLIMSYNKVVPKIEERTKN